MTVATTNARWVVIPQLLDLISRHPNMTDVQVAYEYPGQSLDVKALWISDVAGVSYEVPVQTPDRVMREDIFALTLRVWVADTDDLLPTMEAVAEIIGAVEDVVADDVELGMPGVVIDSLITNVNGPLPVQTDHDGHVGVAEITVQIETRLE